MPDLLVSENLLPVCLISETYVIFSFLIDTLLYLCLTFQVPSCYPIVLFICPTKIFLFEQVNVLWRTKVLSWIYKFIFQSWRCSLYHCSKYVLPRTFYETVRSKETGLDSQKVFWHTKQWSRSHVMGLPTVGRCKVKCVLYIRVWKTQCHSCLSEVCMKSYFYMLC